MIAPKIFELAIAAYKLSAADRALFDIATWDVEIALEHAAIRAGNCFSAPVALFITVTNARNIAPLMPDGGDLLRRDDFLRPSFSHPDTTVNDFFWFGHGRNSSSRIIPNNDALRS